VAKVAKARASASRSTDTLSSSPERDPEWVARLGGEDRVSYYAARLDWAKAEAAFEAVEIQAREARDKPSQDFEKLQGHYRDTVKAKRDAMDKVARRRSDIERALSALSVAEADDPEKVVGQVGALRSAITEYEDAAKTVDAAVKGMEEAEAALRRFAEPQPGVPAERLRLDKDTKAIAEHQYELAVATARDPLEKASAIFNEKRSALFDALRKE
jgi:hypothetical protein